jgi:hypothetical protein
MSRLIRRYLLRLKLCCPDEFLAGCKAALLAETSVKTSDTTIAAAFINTLTLNSQIDQKILFNRLNRLNLPNLTHQILRNQNQINYASHNYDSFKPMEFTRLHNTIFQSTKKD